MCWEALARFFYADLENWRGKFSGSAVDWGGFSLWWSFGGVRSGSAIGGVDGGETLSEAD